MAMPHSVMVAGLSEVFHKTFPGAQGEVKTTIRVCLPAMRLQSNAIICLGFMYFFSTQSIYLV